VHILTRPRLHRRTEREVKKVPLLRGKSVFTLLRGLDAHAYHLRDRREAPVRRRDQPEYHRIVFDQGRDPARHGDNLSAMHADMSSCGIPPRRGAPDREHVVRMCT